MSVRDNLSAPKAAAITVLDTLEEVTANTSSGKPAGALAVKQLNTNVNKVKIYVGSDGKLHFTNASGADTALNFSSGAKFSYTDLYTTANTKRLCVDTRKFSTLKLKLAGSKLNGKDSSYNFKIFSSSEFYDGINSVSNITQIYSGTNSGKQTTFTDYTYNIKNYDYIVFSIDTNVYINIVIELE